MLYLDYTENLLGLKGVLIKNIYEFCGTLSIELECPVNPHVCPACHNSTKYIYDYRIQKIKDIPIYDQPVYLKYRKRRYICKDCGKKFFEQNTFLPKWYRMTNRLSGYVIKQLSELYSMKSIGSRCNVSIPTVCRILNTTKIHHTHLPQVLSIDEFKGDTDFGKYQCILTDPVNKHVFDILPCREEWMLRQYFEKFKDRNNVKFVVIDMWKPYYITIKRLFPNAVIVTDKYHYIRQCYWALEAVRKRVQKDLPAHTRKYFKRSRQILLCKAEKLSDGSKIKRDIMLSINHELYIAYQLKEQFRHVISAPNSSDAKTLLNDWINDAKKSGIPEFKNCLTAYTNWQEPILSSFDCTYTNGFTEGINNKIKVLKRNAFGVKNFYRFRTRIMLTCSKNISCAG